MSGRDLGGRRLRERLESARVLIANLGAAYPELLDPMCRAPRRALHILRACSGLACGLDERAQRVRQHFPNAEINCLDNAGHWVMYQRADAYNPILLRQLKNPGER